VRSIGAELTGDGTYFTSGGSAVGLEGFVELITGWTSLEIEVAGIDLNVSADARLAWATFRGVLSGEADGDMVRLNLRFTAIFNHTDAGWKLRHLQSTIASNAE
jgi:ketosteroid isomerase-like protein